MHQATLPHSDTHSLRDVTRFGVPLDIMVSLVLCSSTYKYLVNKKHIPSQLPLQILVQDLSGLELSLLKISKKFGSGWINSVHTIRN